MCGSERSLSCFEHFSVQGLRVIELALGLKEKAEVAQAGDGMRVLCAERSFSCFDDPSEERLGRIVDPFGLEEQTQTTQADECVGVI